MDPTTRLLKEDMTGVRSQRTRRFPQPAHVFGVGISLLFVIVLINYIQLRQKYYTDRRFNTALLEKLQAEIGPLKFRSQDALARLNWAKQREEMCYSKLQKSEETYELCESKKRNEVETMKIRLESLSILEEEKKELTKVINTLKETQAAEIKKLVSDLEQIKRERDDHKSSVNELDQYILELDKKTGRMQGIIDDKDSKLQEIEQENRLLKEEIKSLKFSIDGKVIEDEAKGDEVKVNDEMVEKELENLVTLQDEMQEREEEEKLNHDRDVAENIQRKVADYEAYGHTQKKGTLGPTKDTNKKMPIFGSNKLW